MTGSALQEYARGILTHVPWEHWLVMVVVSLALTVILLIQKKCSVYGAIVLGLTVFTCLVILDTAVVIRYLGFLRHGTGRNLELELDRLLHGSELARNEVISNVVVFVPFGFFLEEFFAATKRFGGWWRLGFVAMSAWGLSFCIEFLQLVLRVGYFEVMDLLLNTLGGVLGAVIAIDGRALLVRGKRC